MDAPNPVAATKAAPGKLSKIIKGHKPIVYIGVIGFAVILAYYIHKRQQDQALLVGAGPDPQNATVTDPSATPDYGSPYSGGTFGPTQGAADLGAYYGYPTPDAAAPSGFSTQDLVDLLYAFNQGGGYYSGQPAASPDPQVGAQPGGNPTGGGVSTRNVSVHAAPAKATIVANIPKGGTSSAIHDHPAPPDPHYPFLSTRGWYAVVTNYKKKGDRWHFYANGVKEKVG